MARLPAERIPFFRLSPAQAGRTQCFAIRPSDANERFDARHHAVKETLRSAFPIATLGDLVSVEPAYGSSQRALPRISESQPRYIRITDFGDDGIEPGHEFTTLDAPERKHELELNDLLFARTGSVGKTYIHEDVSEPAVFAGYCIRFRFDAAKVLPEYVYWWTKTDAYARWVNAIQRPSVQANINKEEFKRCPIPLPSLEEQRQFASAMTAARAERKAKRAEADALLSRLDDFVLSALGIAPPEADKRRVFAVRMSDLSKGSLSPSHHAPALRHFIGALRNHPAADKPLSAYVEINPSAVVAGLPADAVVGFLPMQAVSDGVTGEHAVAGRPLREVGKGYTPFVDGDILWAKITPCMENGKVCIVDGLPNGVGFGSTEFHVLRAPKDGVLAEFVKEFISQRALRRVAVLAFTGSAGQQRIPASFLASLPFPAIPLEKQREIVAEVRAARECARELREQGEQAMRQARAAFEEGLSG